MGTNEKPQATPGPWVYHSGMVWKPDGSEDGIPIARMDRDTPRTKPTERDANARLIAAAPQMREALEAVLSLIVATDSDGRAFTGDNRTEYTTTVEPLLRAALRAAGGDVTETREHDDECVTRCPVPSEYKCRIGHGCWCAEESQP